MVKNGSYGGDAALAGLLAAAGLTLDVAAVRAIAAGVAAAPPAVDPAEWLILVGSDLPPELAGQLLALMDQVRNDAKSGLDVSPAPAGRLKGLRAELAARGVDGFLVPLSDEYQSEFPPARTRRLAWLTGFGGSAGIAAVLAKKAAIFVDGRYTLQVREQVDPTLFEIRHLTEEPVDDWLAANAPKGGRIGYDPWIHTVDGLARLRGACERAGAELVPVEPNPLDAVWGVAQPARPVSPVRPHGTVYAGRSAADKRQEAARAVKGNGAEAAVISAPDSIAWLLNIRGGDVPNTPLALGFAILKGDASLRLFMDGRKLPSATLAHLGNEVTVEPQESFADALMELGAKGATVQAESGGSPSVVFDRLEAAGAIVLRKQDPCTLPKACKNATELAGTRAAHIRDGAALTSFLAWLSVEAPKGGLDEIAAVERLYEFRRTGELFRGLSFETISGAGPNGAIVHYRVTPETNRKLKPGELYLVDSGAQYLDGTTDVTRTVAIGTPTAEMRDRFTRVLKGHIAIATARFPAGTAGGQLDTLARRALWEVGLDFDHGTGHGVGSYLGVHEGPQRIAKRLADVPLRPGMILSNEPGYYKTGGYGIRIENLEVVRAQPADPAAEREMLGFEALTLAPIDLACVEPAIMTDQEIAWLNGYHRRVRETLTSLVDAKTAAWLKEASREILI